MAAVGPLMMKVRAAAERLDDAVLLDRDDLMLVTLSRAALPSLAHFKHFERGGGVSLEHGLQTSADLDPWYRFMAEHLQQLGDAFFTYDINECPSPRKKANAYECWLTAGWRRSGFRCGLHIGAISPAFADLEYRARLLGEAVRAWGLENSVKVILRDGHLFLNSEPPGALELYYHNAGLGGADPLGFDVGPIRTLELTRQALETAVEVLARRVHRVSWFTKMRPAAYESCRAHLSSLAGGWEIGIAGCLHGPVESLVAKGAPAPGDYLPIFQWLDEDTDHTFSLDLLRDHDGRLFAEVHSDCADRGRVASFATELTGLAYA